MVSKIIDKITDQDLLFGLIAIYFIYELGTKINPGAVVLVVVTIIAIVAIVAMVMIVRIFKAQYKKDRSKTISLRKARENK